MKTSIHPTYGESIIRCACGAEYKTRSTQPEMRVELCSHCHPFYTGEQRIVDTAGRVDRFNRRYAKAAPRSAEEAAEAVDPVVAEEEHVEAPARKRASKKKSP